MLSGFKNLKFIIIKTIIWNRHKCLLSTLLRIKIYVCLAVILQDVDTSNADLLHNIKADK